jgi:hypothetical protein
LDSWAINFTCCCNSDSLTIVNWLWSNCSCIGFNVLGIQIQGEDNRSSTLSLIALFSGALAVAGTLGLDYKSELARRNIREDVKLWTSLTTLRKEADSISVSVATRIMKSVAYQNPQSAFVASDDISDLSMVSTQAQTLIAYLEQGEQIPSDVMDDKYEFLESLIQAKDIQDSTKLTLLRTIANL